MQLFGAVPMGRTSPLTDEVHELASRAAGLSYDGETFTPGPDERTLEVYRRAENPGNPFELRDLWIGRVEHELGAHAQRPEFAERWRRARERRHVTADDVLSSRSTVRFVKELFNFYFRDDLYGDLRADNPVILSGGSVDEEAWGLPAALKDCIRFALDRDLYGYSDSRGRIPAREAIAAYENVRIEGSPYHLGNVAITMGGTFAVSTLADFLLHETPATGAPALCGIPNYPPLVETVARRRATQLVPLPSRDGETSLEPLIAALRPDTPLVLLQTVANPTGAIVPEAELKRLIEAASPFTMILLDECHEWLGPVGRCSAVRAAPNVIRVSSLSKTWSAPGLKVGWLLADERVIADYYEYASTTFGGPPSFFYTLVEVLARMERWMISGLDSPGRAEAAEFEDLYELDPGRLRVAYDSYRRDRIARDDQLLALRDASAVRFADASAQVVLPRCSINLALRFPGRDESYLAFRDLFRRTGVSLFPGVLTFCFSGGTMRTTTARRWDDIAAATDRLGKLLTVGVGR